MHYYTKEHNFFYISTTAEKVKVFHLYSALEYSKHFSILLIWISKQPRGVFRLKILPIFAEKETKAESK